MSAAGSTTITADTRLCAAPGQVSRELAGESVIMQVKSGRYFGVDGVAARLWELLQKPISAGDLNAAILREFDVTAERAAADIDAFVQKLLGAKLIEVMQ
jgi:hypothetical protein